MRSTIAGGLMMAAVIAPGVGGYLVGESLNDNPEGSELDEKARMDAAYAGYIALADDDCEATVLATLSTLEDEWYEPPKSESSTKDALDRACEEDSDGSHEELAGEASRFFDEELDGAIGDYKVANNNKKFDTTEKMLSALMPYPIIISLVFAGSSIIGIVEKRRAYRREDGV